MARWLNLNSKPSAVYKVREFRRFMKQALHNENVNARAQSLRLTLLAFFVVSLLSGCGRGYVVDKDNNKVIYETSDEGRGIVQTVVTNADAATFEVLKLQGPGEFARDKNHVYFYGILVPGAHPESFQRFKIPGEPHIHGGAQFYYYRDSERVFIYPYTLS
jgi:hypothetical protein